MTDGTPSALLVVSWNIQFGVEVDRAAELLAGHQRLVDADIVLLQEMDREGTERIAAALGAHHTFAALGPHRATGREFGNAVLARRPLGPSTVTPLPFTAPVSGQERLLVHTELDDDGAAIRVGSVHTEVPTLRGTKRAEHLRAVAAATGDAPAIVGGDFNTATRSALATLDDEMAAVGARRVSAGSGPTLRRAGRNFTLDHVYARGFEPVGSGSVDAGGASDHRPIWVRLRRTVTTTTR